MALLSLNITTNFDMVGIHVFFSISFFYENIYIKVFSMMIFFF